MGKIFGMKLTSKKTYGVIYHILGNREFTQLHTSKALGVSFGLVNKVVQWLVKRRFAEKRGNRYYLADPSGLVALFALDRDMNSLLLKKIAVNVSKEKVLRKMPKNCVLCLESALEKYSSYYRSNRVCVYAPTKKEAKEIDCLFQAHVGGHVEVWVFKPDFEPETAKASGKQVTTRLRTLIDLVCDNKTFYAKDLFRQLWKVEFLES